MDKLVTVRANQVPGPEQPFVLHEQAGGVVRLTLNRPDRFNPLSSAMIAALRQRLDEVAGDKEARVVVLAAAGRGFCAGHDLKEMRAHATDAAPHPSHTWEHASRTCHTEASTCPTGALTRPRPPRHRRTRPAR